MTPLLDVRGLSISFGGLRAVQDFNITLWPGAMHGLIGPNGAGKTTVFNLLTGVYRPRAGTTHLAGRLLNGLRPDQIAAAGLARTFQASRLFSDLTVLDNVLIGARLRARHGLTATVLRTTAQRAEERVLRERAMVLLNTFGLQHRVDEHARNLPYGDQRRLEMARALATDPRVLLLDEPAAGMNPQEKLALRELIRTVRRDFKVTILLIEHDMSVVMDICEQITVLDHGVTIALGTPAEVQANPRVIEAYLGTPAEMGGAETQNPQTGTQNSEAQPSGSDPGLSEPRAEAGEQRTSERRGATGALRPPPEPRPPGSASEPRPSESGPAADGKP